MFFFYYALDHARYTGLDRYRGPTRLAAHLPILRGNKFSKT